MNPHLGDAFPYRLAIAEVAALRAFYPAGNRRFGFCIA
jgi:hypothetical protein